MHHREDMSIDCTSKKTVFIPLLATNFLAITGEKQLLSVKLSNQTAKNLDTVIGIIFLKTHFRSRNYSHFNVVILWLVSETDN